MTLEEAIKHAEEVAEENKRVVDKYIVFGDVKIDMLYCDDTEVTEEHLVNCQMCAKEHRQLAEWLKDYKRLLEQESKWIPIKTRPLTDKEKEEYAYLGYSEEELCFMYDCLMPEDGEEVLITTRYDEVKTDTFYRDEGGYFESYCDEDDIKAWMPLPKPYEPQERSDKE